MVERTSQPLQLASGNLGQYGGYRPGQARAEQVQTEPSLGMQALSGLLKIGGAVAEQAFQTDVKEAYMQGQRARMLGKSLEDEEADVLAKPFVRGGYQDQDYRVRQAELQQKMTNFIAGKGRTLPPEQFVAELARESSAVLESMGDGLSNVGREQALMAQTQLEETLIGTHGKAYLQYGIEQAGLRYTTGANAVVAQIASAKASGDDTLASEASARAVLFIEDIQNSDKITDQEMRNEISVGFIQHLLSPGNDNQELVQAMLESGQLDKLPPEQRSKINDWMYASQGRTVARDNVDQVVQDAFFTQRLASRKAGFKGQPVGEPVSLEELNVQMALNVQRRPRTAKAENEALAQLWVESTNNSQDTTRAISALVRGDKQELYRMGVTEQQAASLMFEQGSSRDVPISQMIPAMVTAGLQLGFMPKEAKDNIDNATRAVLASPDAANPEQVAILGSFLDTLKAAGLQRPGAESVMLGALDKDTNRVLSRALIDSTTGTSPVDSIRNTAFALTEWNKLTEEERIVRTKGMQKAVNEMLTPGFFTNAYAAVNPNVSRVDLESPEFQQYSQALMQQTVALSRQPDFAWESPAVLAKMAEGMVANRTVTVVPEGGAESKIVLPEAAVPVFGLTEDSQRTRFSEALTELYGKKEAGTEARFRMIGGVLSVQRIVDGIPGPARPVDPEKIKTRMQEKIDDAKGSLSKPIIGYDYDIGGGASIRVNGNNPIGLDRGWAMKVKEQLLKDESVKLTVYPDKTADGTQVGLAVGVGKNVTGKLKEGDRISLAEAEAMFTQSTNEAFEGARSVARDWGVTNPQQIAALALATYQMGPAGLKQFKDTKAAYQAGDVRAFVAAVRDSDWARQTPSRVETFLDMFLTPQ